MIGDWDLKFVVNTNRQVNVIEVITGQVWFMDLFSEDQHHHLHRDDLQRG